MSIRPQRARGPGRTSRENPRAPAAAGKAGHLVVIPGGAGKDDAPPKPAKEIEGRREKASRPRLPRPGPEAAPAPSKAIRPSLPFALLCSLIVGASILGLVVLNVLVAQSSFRLGDLKAKVEEEKARSRKLHYDVSAGESPARLAEAAHRLGLVIPERQETLVGPPDPALSSKGNRELEDVLGIRSREGREAPADGQRPGRNRREPAQEPGTNRTDPAREPGRN
jgi:hypothetical protein